MKFTQERIDSLNAERLAKICPTVAEKTRRLITQAKADGYVLLVVKGLRTVSEQNALFAQGRSKPGKVVTNARGGQSLHNFGLAVDFAFVTGGTIDYQRDDALFSKIGAWAKASGLSWGGDWTKFKDRPHVEYANNLKLAAIQALHKQGGLSAVWAKVGDAAPMVFIEQFGTVPDKTPRTYAVQSGDTLGGILKKFNLKKIEFYQKNNLHHETFDENKIRVGDVYKI